MRTGVGLVRQGRWWASGALALLVHVAAVFPLPDVAPRPSANPRVEQPLVWLASSTSGETQGVIGEALGPTSEAALASLPAPAALPRRPRRRQAAAPLQASQPATVQAATDSASLPESGAATAHSNVAATLAAHLESALPGVSAAGAGAGTSRGDGLGLLSGAASGALVARAPRLLALHDPCAGYFPQRATIDHGVVQIDVEVDEAGRPQVNELLQELPRGQGFGDAARACAAHLRFVPALDGAGTPSRGHAKLELRFDRRHSSDS